MALASSADALPHAAPPNSLVVTDRSSEVTYSNLSHGIESFLDIRIGKDTNGRNRFAPPKPFSYPKITAVNAPVHGTACPQAKAPIRGLYLFNVSTDISENCLTLRVDRVQNTTAHARLPVMV